MLSDVIAAISTPQGFGGVAVIRVSGNGAPSLVSKIFFPRSGKSLLDYPARHAVFGEIRDERSIIDTALVTYFNAPNSFTGEDVVEISCHGGYLVSAMVLEAVLSLGIRHAEAGEFTKRAFVNNKISLSEAEALSDVLNAVCREGVRLSSSQARGVLGERIKEISDKLITLISSIYAYIDYPEEDLEDVDDKTLLEEINLLITECQSLLSTYRAGNAITHGIPTVIVGKTNAGKSSMFNKLLGEDKAIVTDIPGTTRDVLEYTADVRGVTLKLVDTAGLREETGDKIEQLGIEIAKGKLSSPETSLILALFDSSREFDDDDVQILELLEKCTDKTIIPVFTKSDMPTVLDRAKIEAVLGPGIDVSSKENRGIDKLQDLIFESFVGEKFPLPENAVITGARQKSTLERGLSQLQEAKRELCDGVKDMTGMILESALATLSEVDARQAGEKIVDEIFSKFCVGK